MTDHRIIAVRTTLRRIAGRLRDASHCANVRLTSDQERECLQLAECLEEIELELIDLGILRRQEQRRRRTFDPLAWLQRTSINPQPSTINEAQHA